MLFEWQDFMLLVTVVLNGTLGLLIFIPAKKNPINISFAGFAFGIAFWPLTLAFFRNVPEWHALLWLRLSLVSTVIFACAFWLFAHYFPDRKPLSLRNKLLTIMVSGGMLGALLHPRFLVDVLFENTYGRGSFLVTPHYVLYAAYFIFFFVGGLAVMGKKYFNSRGIAHTQSGYIFWSVLIAGSFGAFFNLVLPSPLFDNFQFIWLGPLFTFVILLATFFAVAHYQLMNLKVLGVEFLTVFIVSILFFDMLTAREMTGIISRVVTLIVALIFGIFLIISVKNEVRRREKAQELALTIKHANTRLRALDRVKTEFISIAAHQLRTPLSIIRGYAELLTEGAYGALPTQAVQTVAKVDAATNRLVKLVDDLLDVTHIESGRIEYRFRPVHLPQLIQELVDEFSQRVAEKGLTLTFEKPPSKFPQVILDLDKLRHALANFLDNTIKYTEKGSVVITVARRGDGVELRVKDTGIGVLPADRENIFQKFYRGKIVSERFGPGTGLGLYVARKFIEAHGGKIFVESKGVGKGATFGFWIPLKPNTRRAGNHSPPLDVREMEAGHLHPTTP